MSKVQDKARSISKKLSTLAKKLNVPYSKILTEFLIERLIVRLLLDEDLASKIVFKGGYVSLRVYDSPRFTVDLDALLRGGNVDQLVSKAKASAENDIDDGVWFKFEKTVDLAAQGEYGGLRLVFRSGVGEVLKDLRIAQVINFDIGIGDPIVPGPVKAKTPFLLGAGEISWNVYPVETIVAEKLHALITRGSDSSRSKDIFDLNLFLPKCSRKDLQKALKETFGFRGDALPSDLQKYLEGIDRTLLKLG